jgi:hypothetical protein
MFRRDLLKSIAPLLAPISWGHTARAAPASVKTANVLWKPISTPPAQLSAFEGFTDCVPDIVGRIGSRIDLAIFTEGNHFPALLGMQVLEPFRKWTLRDSRYAKLTLENIVIVTLPQPIIVSMIANGGIVLGNMILSVDRESAFYPDIVMGGQAPLKALAKTRIIEQPARIFAKSRGPALLVRADNPLGISGLDDLIRPEVRLVLASAKEPGARNAYFSALDSLMGNDRSTLARRREIVDFPGRLGVQHRDVLQALSMNAADVGIIVAHLAQYFALTYPEVCRMIPLPGADRFPSTIALATVVQPLRRMAAQAFSEFFFGVARDVYPQHGFAEMNSTEYGAILILE